METVNNLLDKCKEISSSRTDMALAELLGVGRTAVSNYRKSVSYPDAVVCAKIAAVTKLPLAKVLGIVGEARAISDAEKKVWRKLSQVAVLILCCLPIASIYAGYEGLTSDSLYIMSAIGMAGWGLFSMGKTYDRSRSTAL